MVEGIEFVSNLITRYAIVERLYLPTVAREGPESAVELEVKATEQLTQAILKLYISILKYLSNARRYYDHHTASTLRFFDFSI